MRRAQAILRAFSFVGAGVVNETTNQWHLARARTGTRVVATAARAGADGGCCGGGSMMATDSDPNRWHLATFSLGFLLLAVYVARGRCARVPLHRAAYASRNGRGGDEVRRENPNILAVAFAHDPPAVHRAASVDCLPNLPRLASCQPRDPLAPWHAVTS